MRRSAKLLLIGLTVACSACSDNPKNIQLSQSAPSDAPVASKSAGDFAPQATPASVAMAESAPAIAQARQEGLQKVVSLDSAGATQAFMRKVIQNAEMTIETDKPNEGQQKIGVIAEKHGGFVVISESKHNEAASQNV